MCISKFVYGIAGQVVSCWWSDVAQLDITVITIFGFYKSSIRHMISFTWCNFFFGNIRINSKITDMSLSPQMNRSILTDLFDKHNFRVNDNRSSSEKNRRA